MEMKTWDPQLGAELLRQIGDPNDVDRCSYITHAYVATAEWRRCVRYSPITSRSSWWLQLQPFYTQPADTRIMPHLLEAGYTGRHLTNPQLAWLIRVAVMFDDVQLAVFVDHLVKVYQPDYPRSWWQYVLRYANFDSFAESDGYSSTDCPRHILRRLETICKLNRLVGDTFSLGLEPEDFKRVGYMSEEQLHHIPLYRLVDADPYIIIHVLGDAKRQSLRESMRRTLHIKPTLYGLAMGNDPARSQQRRTFRGPVRNPTTMWTVPDLVDIVLAYDSDLSKVALNCAHKTVTVLDTLLCQHTTSTKRKCV
jgi:hypothetical protein